MVRVGDAMVERIQLDADRLKHQLLVGAEVLDYGSFGQLLEFVSWVALNEVSDCFGAAAPVAFRRVFVEPCASSKCLLGGR